jgi:hypothetical protein
MTPDNWRATHPFGLPDIILLGTGPRGGEGMVFEELSVDELDDEAGLLMDAFFTQSEPSKAAGRAYIERLTLRARRNSSSLVTSAAPASAARSAGQALALGDHLHADGLADPRHRPADIAEASTPSVRPGEVVADQALPAAGAQRGVFDDEVARARQG